MEMIRTFVAIELDEEALEWLKRVQERLKTELPQGIVRWVDPKGIHLTLKFLGEIPANKVKAVEEVLKEVSHRHRPFYFDYGGLGCFPSSSHPNVVWVGVEEKTGALLALQQDVERSLLKLGFRPEDRPFSPHLTLGRVSKGASSAERKRLGEYIKAGKVGSGGKVLVKAISLMKSDLRPSGAVYTRLALFPLKSTG
ncbi:MAG: RNA 2',3'-cyclic phosphodiesterase [Anaerolineae bacterium]|nr:RNA 2',3'-cyclic phosphodiesterase [Anaerolineae bacterium]MDW8102003.1 RNA 2',3'-cyclic phosphodiesterase [Anaerolineae bacterium]